MTRLAPLVLATLFAASPSAQTAPFSDPANLRGERPRASDGRELPVDQGARGLQQMLRKLNTRASLMLIVAHPDDEDGGMLTLYSRGLGARVAMLTLNRGEGGQNAMTGDFEDALGLLRTQELLAADRYLGVDQMFGTEVDFGFSKTKEEAFSKWTHERVLYDAVRAVRLYRPLVIASVFIGGVTDGHGQHQVSGEIAQEVFKAAGDPKVFPELTAQGIVPWQPLKVYARVPLGAVTERGLFDYATGQYAPARFTNYVTGEVTTAVPSTDVVIHEGKTDPLLTRAAANPADLAHGNAETDAPLSYVQFARIGLGLQKSQVGPAFRAAPAGAFDVAYHLYGSQVETGDVVPADASFFTGIDTTLAGMVAATPGAPVAWKNTLEAIAVDIQSANDALQPDHLERAIPGLRSAIRTLDPLLAEVEKSSLAAIPKASLLHELRVKRVQLNDALLLAHEVECLTDPDQASPHEDGLLRTTDHHLEVGVDVQNSGATHIDFVGGRLRLAQGTPAYQITAFDRFPTSSLASDEGTTVDLKAELPRGLPATRPYFTRRSAEQAVYDLALPELRNAPATPWPITAELSFNDDGIVLLRSVVLRSLAGTLPNQPLTVVPPISITFAVHAQVLPRQTASTSATVITAPAATPDLHVSVQAPAGWRMEAKADETPTAGTRHFRVEPPEKPAPGVLRAVASTPGNDSYSEWYKPVGYGDLPRTNFYTPATDRIAPVDLKLPQRRRIAYLPGTGDAVPESLTCVGLQPTILTVNDLTADKLTAFDTVVLGVRTYNAHPDLHGAATQALLDFARGGGNVLVQYQTAEFTGADAPFPLELGNAEKVVDETAPVHLLNAAAPALSSPNQLTGADFDGWIEERGHGFLRNWSDEYTAPLETHDPGSDSEGVAPQAEQRGGLVTVQLGKGHWTYCAFALYRQLPEAVPGAYRLLANLLALGEQ